MAIGCSFIGVIGTYYIGGYQWLFYWWLLVAINGYWWLFY
jgi:hypothetical protein